MWALRPASTQEFSISSSRLISQWPSSHTFGTATADIMAMIYRKALLAGKCPACRKGDIFKFPLSHIQKFAAMNSSCPVCQANFEPEPGFYFGSMFITYAFNVALVVVAGVLLYYFWKLPEWLFLTVVVVVAAGTMPYSFRMSRILWLYWFGGLHYRGRDKG